MQQWPEILFCHFVQKIAKLYTLIVGIQVENWCQIDLKICTRSKEKKSSSHTLIRADILQK